MYSVSVEKCPPATHTLSSTLSVAVAVIIQDLQLHTFVAEKYMFVAFRSTVVVGGGGVCVCVCVCARARACCFVVVAAAAE